MKRLALGIGMLSLSLLPAACGAAPTPTEVVVVPTLTPLPTDTAVPSTVTPRPAVPSGPGAPVQPRDPQLGWPH